LMIAPRLPSDFDRIPSEKLQKHAAISGIQTDPQDCRVERLAIPSETPWIHAACARCSMQPGTLAQASPELWTDAQPGCAARLESTLEPPRSPWCTAVFRTTCLFKPLDFTTQSPDPEYVSNYTTTALIVHPLRIADGLIDCAV
jgi:hypothetical protein